MLHHPVDLSYSRHKRYSCVWRCPFVGGLTSGWTRRVLPSYPPWTCLYTHDPKPIWKRLNRHVTHFWIRPCMRSHLHTWQSHYHVSCSFTRFPRTLSECRRCFADRYRFEDHTHVSLFRSWFWNLPPASLLLLFLRIQALVTWLRDQGKQSCHSK